LDNRPNLAAAAPKGPPLRALLKTRTGEEEMPRHEEQKTLVYTADELFSVVAYVKDYPSFVPWCSGARILREGQQQIIAELEIGFGPFRESFTSQVALDRPRQVLVHATEGGPLERLTNTWTFTPEGNRTDVDLVVNFQFKSHLLDHVANNMFHEAATRMSCSMSASKSSVVFASILALPTGLEPVFSP
jgi:coenzyme Q-binding protein COQ10